MIVTAIAIKATDGGSIFYRQRRLTKDGKEFDVLKFRSMRMDAEKDGVARLSTGENDPRITKVGRIIRAIRFDELPQLLNILQGDMAIVGPRPERPEISAQYEKDIPEWPLRLQCKCGLTGYAQVYGQYNTTPYDKLLMDLMYIARPSLVEDIKIIFATVKILFMKESTAGVSEGQTTAMGKSSGIRVRERTILLAAPSISLRSPRMGMCKYNERRHHSLCRSSYGREGECTPINCHFSCFKGRQVKMGKIASLPASRGGKGK